MTFEQCYFEVDKSGLKKLSDSTKWPFILEADTEAFEPLADKTVPESTTYIGI